MFSWICIDGEVVGVVVGVVVDFTAGEDDGEDVDGVVAYVAYNSRRIVSQRVQLGMGTPSAIS